MARAPGEDHGQEAAGGRVRPGELRQRPEHGGASRGRVCQLDAPHYGILCMEAYELNIRRGSEIMKAPPVARLGRRGSSSSSWAPPPATTSLPARRARWSSRALSMRWRRRTRRSRWTPPAPPSRKALPSRRRQEAARRAPQRAAPRSYGRGPRRSGGAGGRRLASI